MKHMIDKQLSALTRRYLIGKQKKGETVFLKDLLNTIVNTRELLNINKCMFPGHQLKKYQTISLKDVNDNIVLLKEDLTIIFDTIKEIRIASARLSDSTKELASFNKSTISRLSREIDILRANTISKTHSYIETFKDNGNVETIKNVVIDTNIDSIYLANSSKMKAIESSDVNAIISVDSQTKYSHVEILSEKGNALTGDIIGWESGKQIDYIINHTVREPVTCRLTINILRETLANSFILYPAMLDLTPMEIYLYSDDTEPFYHDTFIASNNTIHTQFQEANVTKIVIEMVRSNETSTKDGYLQYPFSFNGIVLENKNYTDSGFIISKELSVETDDGKTPFTKLAMWTEDTLPTGAYLNYYVSNDGSSWREIIPMNWYEDKRNIIDFLNSSDKIIENITASSQAPWATLTSVKMFGRQPIYNILENIEDNAIVAGAITSASGVIIDESVQVYRGIGDYSITYEDNSSTIEVIASPHIFERVEQKIDLSVQIVEEQVVKSDRSIDTKYPLSFSTQMTPTVSIKIGTRTFDCEAYISGNTIYLSETSAGEPGNIVLVQYTSTLRDIEEIDNTIIDVDPTSLLLTTTPTGTETIDRNNYRFYSDNKFIELSRLSRISNDATGRSTKTLYLSFTYTTRRRDEYRKFETYVKVKTETEITIFPFSDQEILLGNYHKIDDQDVSRSAKLILSAGTHRIETTQPYKTDPEGALDLNDLTRKASVAGIDLSNIDPYQMRAFEKPLRLVAPKKLSNVISPLDHRSISFVDNKIYINFLPEELPSKLNIYPHLSGVNLLCKRAIYDTDTERTFLYYENIPEQFRVSYQTRSEDDELTTFYYKVELSRDSEASIESPMVSKMTINLI